MEKDNGNTAKKEQQKGISTKKHPRRGALQIPGKPTAPLHPAAPHPGEVHLEAEGNILKTEQS